MERRLAAIFAADVVGYSRLIRADEDATIAAFKALRAELVEPCLSEHSGRIVKLMGDGILAEFASVVDAVPRQLPSRRVWPNGMPRCRRTNGSSSAAGSTSATW